MFTKTTFTCYCFVFLIEFIIIVNHFDDVQTMKYYSFSHYIIVV